MKHTFTLLMFLLIPISLSAQWTLTSAPVTNIDGIITDGSKIFVAQKDSGVFVSTDDGETWQLRNNNLFYNFIRGITISGDTIYTYGSGGIQKMNVNDTTWGDNINQGTSSLLVPGSFYLSSYTLGPGIFTSTDYGVNWTLSTINNAPSGGLFTAFLNTGTSLLAGHSWGIYRSSDNGANWDSVKSGFPSPMVSVFLIHSTGIYAAGTYSLAPMLVRSTDDGVTWEFIFSNLPAGTMNSLSSSGFTFYCTVTGRGAYFSTDYGSTWTASNTGIASPNYANNFFIKGSYAFVSANGLWKRPLSEITSVEQESIGDIPKSFLLAQNYPNPFNPETTIEFSIPQREFVRITIINILGEQIETLVLEELPAGNYKTKWNASNYPSGVYIAQLKAGSFSQSKKIVLEK